MTPNGSDYEARLTRMENLVREFKEAVANDHRQLSAALVLLVDQVRRTSAFINRIIRDPGTP